MKNVFFAALLGLFWIGCNQNPTASSSTATPEKQTAASTPVADTGTYIIDDFLVAIVKTKSPYAVSKTADYPLFGFTYTSTQLRGFTVHEGGYDTELQFDQSTQKYSGKGIPGLDPFEFVVAADSSIHLTFTKSGKTYIYRRVPDADSAVRQRLFTGAYIDPRYKPVIQFYADGRLTGLGNEKTYQPIYDFMGGPLDFDEIVIQEKNDVSKVSYYHYRFQSDTLQLYEVKMPRNGEGIEKIGALRYTLFRE